jgi:hypothetical protein
MLEDFEKINELARALASYKCVCRYDQEGEVEGGTLAHGFSDLERSFRKFLSDLLPKLVDGNLSEREACNVLLSIGEEFRHIHYHLRDSRFYRYLWEDAPSDEPQSR